MLLMGAWRALCNAVGSDIAAHRHLVASTANDLLKTLQELNTNKFVPYTPGDPRNLVGAIDTLMRFAP